MKIVEHGETTWKIFIIYKIEISSLVVNGEIVELRMTPGSRSSHICNS